MKNLFKNRNFMLLFNGALVSSIGDVLFNFAIGLYILDVTHSALQLSIYGMIGGVTWIVLSPFGGVWTDRLDRVKILYLTDLIRGITMLLCGIVMVKSHDMNSIMLMLYFTAFINSANGSLFGPASQAMVPMLVKEDELIHANSLMTLMFNIKDVFGMLLAGIMFALLGPIAIVFINSASYIISGVTEMFITVKDQSEEIVTVKNTVLTDLKDGFKYIITANSGIIAILILMNLKNFALGPIQSVLLPYLLNEQIGANEMDLSYIYMCSAIGGIIGSIIVSKGLKSRKMYQTITTSFVMFFLMIVAQFVAYRLFEQQLSSYSLLFIVFCITFVISSIVGIIFYLPMYTMIQKIVEPAYYGRVMSLFTMLSSITFPISTMIGGLIIDKLGVSVLFLMSIVLLFISTGYLMMVKQKLVDDVLEVKKVSFSV